MTDYHVITPEAAELVMQVVDSELIIAPPATPAPAPSSALMSGAAPPDE